MKQLLFIICFVFCVLSCFTSVNAQEIESGICGLDVMWSFDDEGTLTISGNGDMLCNKDLPNSDESETFAIYVDDTIYGYDKYISEIKKIVVSEGVTGISEGAFHLAKSLTSVYLPSTLSSVNSFAFCGCENITSVYHPDLTAWCNIVFGEFESNPLYLGSDLYISDNILESLVVPESITEINDSAFYGCSSIKSVYMHDEVTKIGANAFYFCNALETIYIPQSLKMVGIYAFSKTDKTLKVYVDDLITWCNIDFAVYGNPLRCNGELYVNGQLVTDIVFPDSLDIVNRHSFHGYDRLQSVIIPEGVTAIDHGAFYECTNLKTVSLPKSLSVIEGYAFDSCSSLTSIIIPEGISKISYRSFYDCTDLFEVILPASAHSIETSAFYNCSSLSSINLENATSIASSAFSYCSSLTEIDIPKLNKLENQVFVCCSNLARISMPSVTEIGYGALGHCDKLDRINLFNVISIEKYAFWGCDNLSCIFLPSTISISENSFNTLEIVYYQGTENDWSVLSSDDVLSNFSDAKIYYNVSSDDFNLFSTPIIETQTEKESLILSPYMVPKDSIIILRFEHEGIFTVKTIIYDGTKEITVPLPDAYDKIKILLWDSISSMKPL